MIRRHAWLLCAAGLLLAPSAPRSQEAGRDTLHAQPPARVFDNPAARAVRSNDGARGVLARRLLSLQRRLRRDPESARTELLSLIEDYPQDPQAAFLLARAHRLTGHPDEAEPLLRDLLERYPEASGYWSELVRVLFQSRREEEALAMLEPLLAGGTVDGTADAGQYEQAAELLQDIGRYDLVLRVYRAGLAALPPERQRDRQRLLRSYLDQLSLAGRSRDLLTTLAEEMVNLPDDGLRGRLLAQGERLLEEIENPAELIPVADSLAVSSDDGQLAGAVRHLYLAVGDYGTFADRALAARVDARRRPDWLYEEALRCLEAKRGGAEARRAAARRLFAAVLASDRLADELRAKTRFQLATMSLDEDGDRRLRGEPISEEDVAALRRELRELRRSAVGTPLGEQALLAELRLLRGRLGRPAAADSLLRAWFMEPDRMHDLHTVRGLELELGENLMALSRFDEARAHFTALRDEAALAVVANWSRFRLAQLDILDGAKAAAQDSLAALAEVDPGGVLANDALDLALLLAESAMWPETVGSFLAAALRLEFGGRPGDAADVLLTFADEFPDDPAAPALLYRAGLLLEAAWRGREAVTAWLTLADHHADDFRAPQSLELAARLAYRLGDAERARALLERILNEHPDFPLRPALRDLQELLEEDAS